MSEKRIGRAAVLGLLARSFYLQAAWNYETLQAPGFAHALFPVGRKLSPDRERFEQFAERHTALFNSNPVMASYVIGTAAKMEEEVAAGRSAGEDVTVMKNALAIPLAAAGDRFFWATLRPLAGLLGVLVAGAGGVLGALVLLALYNVYHLYYRVRGVVRGYTLGPEIVNEVMRLNLVGLSAQLGTLGAFFLGVLFVAAGLAWSEGRVGPAFFAFAGMALVVGLLPDAFQKRITEVALCATVAACFLTALGVLS
ncbi:MAG: PTS system mannose/fructose/sorbose family transporter subunit IID [Candidatus Eisenbacteria bacterium]|nr:PTS system mannose/fructose/sorbose family transporter subunit IID [Candidatus Eisenbacteria bacterium]